MLLYDFIHILLAAWQLKTTANYTLPRYPSTTPKGQVPSRLKYPLSDRIGTRLTQTVHSYNRTTLAEKRHHPWIVLAIHGASDQGPGPLSQISARQA